MISHYKFGCRPTVFHSIIHNIHNISIVHYIISVILFFSSRSSKHHYIPWLPTTSANWSQSIVTRYSSALLQRRVFGAHLSSASTMSSLGLL